MKASIFIYGLLSTVHSLLSPVYGLKSEVLTRGGLERTYHIYLPASYGKSRPVPLLIVLHGGGGTGQGMERLTRGGFNILADREGFIIVYPDGVEKHWNDGRDIRTWRAHRERIDDVGFLSALIDRVAKDWNIDPQRVFATGISNGGLMSYRLACELSHKISAIAVVTASLSEELFAQCSPAKPISVLIMNGTKDPLVPYGGGEITGPFGVRKFGKVVSTAETVQFWVKHNACPDELVIKQEPDEDPKDGTRVRREVYSPCKNNTQVVLYTIEGGGHTWPSGWQYLPERVIGKTSQDITATDVIWEFFSHLPPASPVSLSPTSSTFTSIEGFPYAQQSHPNTCGVAALVMLLQYYGVPISEQDLIKEYPDVYEKGWYLPWLWEYAGKKGLKVEYGTGDIGKVKDFVLRGIPVLVYQYSHKTGKPHFRIVTGYDEEKRVFILQDPAKQMGKDSHLSFSEFEELWNLPWFTGSEGKKSHFYFVVRK